MFKITNNSLIQSLNKTITSNQQQLAVEDCEKCLTTVMLSRYLHNNNLLRVVIKSLARSERSTERSEERAFVPPPITIGQTWRFIVKSLLFRPDIRLLIHFCLTL